VSGTASAVLEVVSTVLEVVSATASAVLEVVFETVSTVLVVASETASTVPEVVSETASITGTLVSAVTPSAAKACRGDNPSDTIAKTTHKTDKRCARTNTFVIAGPYANASSMPCLPTRSTVPPGRIPPAGPF
jgi:hypothetical protein